MRLMNRLPDSNNVRQTAYNLKQLLSFHKPIKLETKRPDPTHRSSYFSSKTSKKGT